MEKIILIVSEDPKTQGLLKFLFGERNCHVLFSRARLPDLHRGLLADPDLIVLDVRAPVGEAMELLAAVTAKARPRLNQRYKVMCLAELADREVVLKAKELNAQDFLVRPLDLKAFTARANKLLGRA